MVGVAVGVAALAVLMLLVLILVRRGRRTRKGVYVIHDRTGSNAAATAAAAATAPQAPPVTVVDAGVLFFDETEDGAEDSTGGWSHHSVMLLTRVQWSWCRIEACNCVLAVHHATHLVPRHLRKPV
jgi:hypothetical protein